MKNFMIAFFSFFILDLAWFSLAVKSFNLKMLADIGRIKDGQFDVLYLPAITTYFLMALAISFFVAPKIESMDSWLQVAGVGAIMGIVVYGIYDFTNLAILKKYPLAFAVADMAWGTFAFTVVTLIVKKSN